MQQIEIELAHRLEFSNTRHEQLLHKSAYLVFTSRMQILKLCKIRPKQLESWHFYRKQPPPFNIYKTCISNCLCMPICFPKITVSAEGSSVCSPQKSFFKLAFYSKNKTFMFDKVTVYSQLNSYITLAC